MPFTDEMYPKDPIVIVDAAETEVTGVIEEEVEGEEESREEDPTNGATA